MGMGRELGVGEVGEWVSKVGRFFADTFNVKLHEI